jgi:four helix bundle protein
VGGAQRFEDLVAWQVAREVTREVYTATRSGSFARDFTLVDQMRRSAISIMSNLAEGFERETEVERLRFYSIAKASCAELRSQVYITLDVGYLDDEQFARLMAQAERAAKLIGGLRAAINRDLSAANGRR